MTIQVKGVFQDVFWMRTTWFTFIIVKLLFRKIEDEILLGKKYNCCLHKKRDFENKL